MNETVAFCVIGFTADDRADETCDVRRVHLAIPVDLHDDLGAALQRRAVTGKDCPADAGVRLVTDQRHARVVQLLDDA